MTEQTIPNLTLVVLAYNEDRTIQPFLSECLAYLDTLSENPQSGGAIKSSL